MTHSPEPWKAVELTTTDYEEFLGIEDANGNRVVSSITGVYETHAPGITNCNIERIVACVNACKMVSTEVLEDKEVIICWRNKDDYNGEQLYMMFGTEKQMTEYCQRWLGEQNARQNLQGV